MLIGQVHVWLVMVSICRNKYRIARVRIAEQDWYCKEGVCALDREGEGGREGESHLYPPCLGHLSVRGVSVSVLSRANAHLCLRAHPHS